MRGFFIRLVGNKKRANNNIDIKEIKSFYITRVKIGDFLIITPLLKELKRQIPGIKITVALHPSVKSLVEKSPFVDEIIILEYKSYSVKIMRLLSELKEAIKLRNKYDLYLDSGKNVNFLYILNQRIKGINYLFGLEKYEKYGIKSTELSLYRKYIKREEKDHLWDITMKLLDALGLERGDGKYQVNIGEYEEKYKDYFSKDNFNIIFNFKASDLARTLTIEEAMEILEKLSKKDGNLKIHVLAPPEDYEIVKEQLESRKMENVVLIPSKKNIEDVIGIIKYSDMILSVDTSIILIGSAYNLPIVGIYRGGNILEVNLFAPRSDKYKIIERYKKVNVDEVVEATMNLMEEIENK